jgi:hypothetical protein
MDRLDIDFEWYRDAMGYRLVEAVPPTPAPEMPKNALAAFLRGDLVMLPEGFLAPRPTDPGKPQRIIRAGGTLVPYRPAETLDLMFRELVNTVPTAEGVLGFVSRFGPLTRLGLDEKEGEPIEFAINSIVNMNEFIDAWSTLSGIGKAIQARALESHLGADGLRIAQLDVRLVFDQKARSLKTQLIVGDLFVALWLRMVEVVTSDTVLRRCAHCKALFTAGLGTDRRLDAKFCSDEHRILFNSLKRTPREADNTPDQPRRRGRPQQRAA